MYEHVAQRVSLTNLAETLRECFDLPIRNSQVHLMKLLLARYYEGTYKRLLVKIVAGHLVHADETEVHVRRIGKAYVWVFGQAGAAGQRTTLQLDHCLALLFSTRTAPGFSAAASAGRWTPLRPAGFRWPGAASPLRLSSHRFLSHSWTSEANARAASGVEKPPIATSGCSRTR
jgi:hypothetical protein